MTAPFAEVQAAGGYQNRETVQRLVRLDQFPEAREAGIGRREDDGLGERLAGFFPLAAAHERGDELPGGVQVGGIDLDGGGEGGDGLGVALELRQAEAAIEKDGID